MSIKLSDSIRVGQQKPLEDKYFNELNPYTSTTQVNTLLLKSIRHIGLTVNINGEEYWYKDGIEDENLVFKSSQKTIEVNIFELQYDLIYQKKLEPGRLYKITGVEGWCFSGHLIKAIYLKAITNNTLEIEGVGEFYTPKYNTSDSNLGIWKGELLANGMISSASYNIGDKVIWGNLFWENISGEIGNNNYVLEGIGSYKLNNYLSETDWRLITPNDDESLYNTNFNVIKFDLKNNYIYYREDDLGNKYELPYDVLLKTFPNSLVRHYAYQFIYNINSISLFQWGRSEVNNNFIKDSIVLNCNYNTLSFRDNVILEKSIIEKNSLLGVYFIGNKLTKSSINSNYIKTFGSIVNNILDDSEISNNRYYIQIYNNKLINGSKIDSNNDNNIFVTDRITSIDYNILDNNCKISSNTFIDEEEKEVLSRIKSIARNELVNDCSINNNTIKNGSKIFGHTMNYYSTINGNTLDTESNIYNNQLVQNGKIDNNILTGHGRIYGNQLDRLSEITLCKLRISPATSYSTTVKNNRLFTGKIQNVDFGNIVNPVGTNPNDPAFGGNDLSGCIIENNSIIKDLTFPNNGGISLQFIKMNGYSEFKNITVNDSIRNVDFINTIFNETSDYSKLIEGSGYQTNGFTKTYIDGVLLQDKLDEKQNVLTNPITGTGSTNSLVKFLPDGTVGNSSIFDTETKIGIGLIPISERLEIDGKVLATGFKTSDGTPTKALTSDGNTFDLNTKADLVGGKVPSSQLPSYIDDVLEFANLASFPTTGESGKIYIAIDTNLTYRWGGSSYVVMSSSLALGSTQSTAFRGDLGQIAYNHTTLTGNPHNTKVEELTDVSGDATSIVDTDVILKKESGGIWKKLSWSNVKSTLKTYFDGLYAPKSFNVKVTTPSSWVTGTLSETEIYRFSIPANTISSESILSIESMLFNKIGVNGAFQVRVKLTTSATMPTGSTEQIARSPNVSPNTRATAIRKKFYVNGDVIKSQGFDAGLYFDEFNNTDAISSRTLDRTQTYNVIISVTLTNVTDQVRLEGLDFNIK